MKRISMDFLETNNPVHPGTRLFVPGGWIAYVPKVEPDAETRALYTRYFEQSHGPAHARQLALDCIQGVFEGGYINLLRMAMVRRLKAYAKLHPRLLEESEPPYKAARKRYYVARGFDAERIQSTFIPGGNASFADKQGIVEILREMGLEQMAAR